MLVGYPFNSVNKLGQTEVYDKSRLQLFEPQVGETLRRIDGVICARLAFDDNCIVDENVNAKRMISFVMSAFSPN